MIVRICNDKCEIILSNVIKADTWFKVRMGLMGNKNFDCMMFKLFKPYKFTDFHTGFMKYDLDFYFLDKNKKIIFAEHNVKPWREVKTPPKTKWVLEVPSIFNIEE